MTLNNRWDSPCWYWKPQTNYCTCLLSAATYHMVEAEFEDLFISLGRRFDAGREFNANNHQSWSSRLVNMNERNLSRVLQDKNFRHVSAGEPTYWLMDWNKSSDLTDFFVTKGMPVDHMAVLSSLLSSDHSPIIVILSSSVLTVLRYLRIEGVYKCK